MILLCPLPFGCINELSQRAGVKGLIFVCVKVKDRMHKRIDTEKNEGGKSIELAESLEERGRPRCRRREIERVRAKVGTVSTAGIGRINSQTHLSAYVGGSLLCIDALQHAVACCRVHASALQRHYFFYVAPSFWHLLLANRFVCQPKPGDRCASRTFQSDSF